MICQNRNPEPSHCWRWWLALLFLFPSLLRADTIILHLKNGDRLAGTIVSEDTNRVVISTSWIKELSVPLSAIVRREVVATPAIATAPPATNVVTATNAPPAAAPKPAPTVAEQKPAVPPTTNAPAAKSTLAAAPPPKPKGPKPWKAEIKLGADFLSAAKDTQNYYGRVKLTYAQPYKDSPKQFFRNITDYSVDYGRTEDVVSSDRMEGSNKTDFDIGHRKFYIYNQGGAGYDNIRNIELHYEIGPGLGYHLLNFTNFVLNTEVGINYQVQDRFNKINTGTNIITTDSSSEKFFFRLAEDVTWKINKTLTATEKFEFFPAVTDVAQYRMRFESTVSYGFWQRLSLNVTVLDLYDTDPAGGVPNNDLQIRSSLGITF